LNEVDKYFTDGVPVNENILGIKSRYEIQEKDFLKKIQRLNENHQEETEHKAELEEQIKMLKSKAKDLDTEFKKAEYELNSKVDSLKEMKIREEKLKDIMVDDLKMKQELLKDLLTENLKFRRALEKEVITKEKRWERRANEKKVLKKEQKVNADEIVRLKEEVSQLENRANFPSEIEKL